MACDCYMLGLVLSQKIHLGWVNRLFGHFSRKKYLVGMVFDGLLSMLACLLAWCWTATGAGSCPFIATFWRQVTVLFGFFGGCESLFVS